MNSQASLLAKINHSIRSSSQRVDGT